MNLIYFLGRFHVLALHIPITLVLTVVVMEWLSRRDRYSELRGALPFLWGASAVSAIVTVSLGYMHFSEGGFSGSSASAHRFLGSSVAVLTTAAWLLRLRKPAAFERLAGVIGIVLVIVVTLTGHFGGNLTHGEEYLFKYAPQPLRRLAGVQESRPAIRDVATADPFLDIVRPLFAQRCFTCHNDDKRSGGLSLMSYGAVIKGGKDGPVVTPGAPDKSDLIRRINLPADDKDAMPAEGKTPVTQPERMVIRWWIDSGAKTGVPLGKLSVPRDVQTQIAAQLGLAGAQSPGTQTSEIKQMDVAVVERLEAAGFSVRQSSSSETSLVVKPARFGVALTEKQIAQLALAPEDIADLSLANTATDDKELQVISKLAQLIRLRLDNNRVSDAGVNRLKGGLTHLQYLNLYGNSGVSDASVETISSFASLKEVFLWGTAVTPAGLAKLKDLRPQLHIDVGETSFVAPQGKQ